MNKFLLLIAMLVFSSTLSAQSLMNNYQYEINLINEKNNKIQVSFVPPKNNLKEGKFVMPKLIPGYYDALNFGRYISEFKAFNKKGENIAVKRLDTNTWIIPNLKNVAKITYEVSGGWEHLMQKISSAKSPESMFKKDSVFVINYNSLAGYFEEIKNRGYTVTVKKNRGFYASSALDYISKNDTTDIVSAKDYRRLVDAPVLYCVPDTTWIKIGNTNVLVSFYSKEDQSYSKTLSAKIEKILINQQAYLGGKLPVNKYAFLIYHEKIPKGMMGDGLEHNNSTVCLYGSETLDKLPEALMGIASHEFFHILTPLNVHSEEVQNFNFLNPILSRHLWLYEGMTEYATIHMPIKQHMITMQQFLKNIEGKIKGMDGFNNRLSMTEISTNAIKMQDQYMNFYQKGALLGLCLDIRLRELSNGKTGTQELMQMLIKKYGPEKPFRDEDLFNVITALTFPEIRQFFKDYVETGLPIPLKESLQKAGLDYRESTKTVIEINNPSTAQLSLRKAWINQ
ncbi:putative metalloprotease with PDZ domain [Pedobacter cryoconitis]|uniref:Putative metalloprotease with PDZ domain n=1 Tax=Pedobacter cryoconitis TaxID=188932 RepID=A0A7W8ZN31_9SPHI|nr:peptidase M61 [Pedobacter cryoconitis]MBB5637047.1 putative metalloprotease with PDZ domain [Pedobacter cryoconitis]